MEGNEDRYRLARRTLLRGATGVVSLSAVGTASANEREHRLWDRRCPDATIEPTMDHCEESSVEACTDDHPETEALVDDVADALETHYPTVGALIDQGFVPYFDTLRSRDPATYSHWLHPDYIGDDGLLDPARPESVLVDNEWWRPIGVMFVATRDGERVDPPSVYEEDGDRCSPWHYHSGLPGRFAWWYYRAVYEGRFEDGDPRLPCRTPCLMHVWTVPHPHGAYAHSPPPREERGGPPAEEPGFDTDAEPGTDVLDWDVLPDNVVPETKPEEYSLPFP